MSSQVNGERTELNFVEPLEETKLPFLENGAKRDIPALHKNWVADYYFLPYCPPPQKVDGSFILGAKENWLEQVRMFYQDMKWLLQLKQHKFWSQVIYDTSTMATIVSFLQEAMPYYALNDFPNDDELWLAYEQAYRLVLLVVNRLATNKESETSYMTSKFHADLIYDHYIFTVPVLLDLCLLCGHNNRSILIHIFNTVFKAQPKYFEDLKRSVMCIMQVLQSVSQCLGLKMPLDYEPERITQRDELLTCSVLSDVIVHVLDTACTLSVLTDVFTPACNNFHQQNFEVRLVWFYENAIPELYSKLETLVSVDEEPVSFVSLKHKLDIARVELLKTFRNTLFCNINSAIESSDPGEVMNSVDDYVTVMTECLAEKLFMRDYHLMYNVGQDLDLLAQLSPDMDADKRSYIFEAVIDSLDGPEISLLPTLSSKLPQGFPSQMNGNSCKEDCQPSTSNANLQGKGKIAASSANNTKVTGVKLDSLISQVKDILPHLGDGFIEQCLEHYNYVSEDVINSILESKLPSSLNDLDQMLPRIPPETDVSVPTVEISIVSDEEEPQFAHAHKGKRKDMYRDVMMMINDKSHREDLREFYSPFSLYEDEYDDTYDDRLDVTIGDDDKDPERSNPVSECPQTAASSSEDEDSDEGATANHFVANPERVRALQEQRRLAKGYQGSQRRDVVGKTKGQGQEKSVIVNRNKKTVHKSQRANHNRRSGAQRKRQQGMVPS